MRKLSFFAGALALGFPASAAVACTVVTLYPRTTIKVIAKVPYGLGQSGFLNIPVGIHNPPVILMAHGADHSAGASGLQTEAEKLAYNNNAAVFNIDYDPGAAVQDFRCAARWLGEAANGTAYGFDTTRHGAIGFSGGAGPMAAAFLASDADHHDNAACPSTAPVTAKAVALFYGAYDSSYTYVQSNQPTTTKWLLTNGSKDSTVPVTETPDMAHQLSMHGWDVYWSGTVQGLPHGFGVYSYNIWPQELPVACDVDRLFGLLQ